MATLSHIRYPSENRAAGATEMKTGHFFALLLNYDSFISGRYEIGKDYVARISASFNRLAGFSALHYTRWAAGLDIMERF